MFSTITVLDSVFVTWLDVVGWMGPTGIPETRLRAMEAQRSRARHIVARCPDWFSEVALTGHLR